MARPRSPERDEAKRLFLESDGKLKAKEIAEKIGGIKPERIRKWKSEDGWQTALEAIPRKRGGQPGNKNAVGGGAPFANLNAETHGAYSKVRFETLPPDVREYIENTTTDPVSNMLHELQLLRAKEYDLQRKIDALENGDPDALYIDKVIHMLVPRGESENDETSQKATIDDEEQLKTAMQTIIKASPFDRAMKLEAELNKTHGRIIKLLDSIKAYELECRRVTLEERKYRLAKQKMNGEFEIDPETGEINDTYDPEDDWKSISSFGTE